VLCVVGVSSFICVLSSMCDVSCCL
jgi:hypothetical protein